MIERVRIADGDQHIPRPGIDLIEREIRGRKQIERIPFIAGRRRRRLASDEHEPQARCADKGGCGKRRTVAERQHRKDGSHRYCPRDEQPQRNLAASEMQIHRRPKWLRGASNSSKPPKRRNRQRQHRRDGDGVSLCQPCESTSAGHNQEHSRGGSDIGATRGRAEARVQRCETWRQRSVRRCPVKHALGVGQSAIQGRKKNEQGSRCERQCQQIPDPSGSCQMLSTPDQRRIEPSVDRVQRHQASEEKRSQCGDEKRKRDDEQARAAQRLHSRRREIMSRADQRLAAADSRKRERDAERD